MPHAFPFEHLIATTQDWPTQGVLFRDISPLLAQRFPETIEAMAQCVIPAPGPAQSAARGQAPAGISQASGGAGLRRGDTLSDIDAFAGVDARGFIFAAALAQKFGKNLVMIRKGGKLPPPSLHESCTLEYGTATFELKPAIPKPDGSAPRIIILDDVLATGGTLRAAADLCARAGYDVVGLAVLINLAFLNNFEWRGLRVKAVVTYE